MMAPAQETPGELDPAGAVDERTPPLPGGRTPAVLPVRVYHQPAKMSVAVVVVYLALVGVLLAVYVHGTTYLTYALVLPVLALLILLYLARYLSTRYRIDLREIAALRLFGSVRVPLSRVVGIRPANLRDLAPVGLFGTWGWRGRVWCASVGTIDTVSTHSEGLLITGGAVPLFISPDDPIAFQRELSRRTRTARPGQLLDEPAR
ncbi:MAG: hypothetical protein ACYDFT_03780 [Thermoplasmata archaeon]